MIRWRFISENPSIRNQPSGFMYYWAHFKRRVRLGVQDAGLSRR